MAVTAASLATTTTANQGNRDRDDNRGNREQGGNRDNGNRDNGNRDMSNNANGRRGRRGRQRNGPRPDQQSNAPVSVLVADGTTTGWFDPRAMAASFAAPKRATSPTPAMRSFRRRSCGSSRFGAAT